MRRLLRWRTVQCLAVLFCAWHLYRHHFNSAPSKRTKTITRSKVVADDDGGSAHESDNESTEGRAKSFRRPRAAKNRRPNILFILADDLGYDDVPWKNPHVEAPNLMRLASEGVVLDSHYSQSVCTPARAALLTGYYPIRMGLQHDALHVLEHPEGLPTKHMLMPQYLSSLGYTSYMVGKWHLGHCHRDYLPHRRGFSTFHGFLSCAQGYFTHLSDVHCSNMWKTYHLYDFWENDKMDFSANGTYSTELFYKHTSRVLSRHRTLMGADSPFFLFLSLQSVHTPLECLGRHKKAFRWIREHKRMIMLCMIAAMDLAIGQIMEKLSALHMEEDTIVVFTSDNGPTRDGSAYPLRGGKRSIWEGGHRTPTLIFAPRLIKWKGIWKGLFHITDWLPTLYSAALAGDGNGDSNGGFLPADLDGVDQWRALAEGGASARQEMLYNINPHDSMDRAKNAAIRVGDLKLIRGQPFGGRSALLYGKWVPPERTESRYLAPNYMKDVETEPASYDGQVVRLYNLTDDPGEEKDMARGNPDLVERLHQRLLTYEAGMERNVLGLWNRHDCLEPPSGVVSVGWCARAIVDLSAEMPPQPPPRPPRPPRNVSRGAPR